MREENRGLKSSREGEGALRRARVGKGGQEGHTVTFNPHSNIYVLHP
jgi:hypothetical protein